MEGEEATEVHSSWFDGPIENESRENRAKSSPVGKEGIGSLSRLGIAHGRLVAEDTLVAQTAGNGSSRFGGMEIIRSSDTLTHQLPRRRYQIVPHGMMAAFVRQIATKKHLCVVDLTRCNRAIEVSPHPFTPFSPQPGRRYTGERCPVHVKKPGGERIMADLSLVAAARLTLHLGYEGELKVGVSQSPSQSARQFGTRQSIFAFGCFAVNICALVNATVEPMTSTRPSEQIYLDRDCIYNRRQHH